MGADLVLHVVSIVAIGFLLWRTGAQANHVASLSRDVTGLQGEVYGLRSATCDDRLRSELRSSDLDALDERVQVLSGEVAENKEGVRSVRHSLKDANQAIDFLRRMVDKT